MCIILHASMVLQCLSGDSSNFLFHRWDRNKNAWTKRLFCVSCCRTRIFWNILSSHFPQQFFLLLVCILISELKASEHRFENWLCLDDTPLRIMCAYEPKTKKIAFMGNAFYFIGIASAFRNDKIPRGYYYQCKRDSIEVQMGEKWRTKWKNVRKKWEYGGTIFERRTRAKANQTHNLEHEKHFWRHIKCVLGIYKKNNACIDNDNSANRKNKTNMCVRILPERNLWYFTVFVLFL